MSAFHIVQLMTPWESLHVVKINEDFYAHQWPCLKPFPHLLWLLTEEWLTCVKAVPNRSQRGNNVTLFTGIPKFTVALHEKQSPDMLTLAAVTCGSAFTDFLFLLLCVDRSVQACVGRTVLLPTVYPGQTSGWHLSVSGPVFVTVLTLDRKANAARHLSWERKLLWLLCQPQNDRVLGLFQLLHCRAATACKYEINMEDKQLDTIFSCIAALFKVEVGMNQDLRQFFSYIE